MKHFISIVQRSATSKEARMLLFLMIIGTICTLLLGSANIAFQKASDIFERRLHAEILDQFEIPYTESTLDDTFQDNFTTRRIGANTYYIGKPSLSGGETGEGPVVFQAEGPGLWSVIEILLAVSPDFQELEWMTVLAQAETPGLGGRITEPQFQQRFEGVQIRPRLLIEKFASAPNEVDGVTGASATSEALEDIINNAIDRLDQAFPEREAS